MENTLKVTNVLSDPTRFNIYQYIIQHHKPVSVLEMADRFNIHPNVARLHLSKLEEIRVVRSHLERTGRGGRPSRLYELSDNVIELNFPHRDYKLLSSIAIESLMELGETGKTALYETGRKYGEEVMEQSGQIDQNDLSIDQKILLLEDAGTMLGMYPKFEYHQETNSISFQVNNCPFKELVEKNQQTVCHLHHAFLEGMFTALFEKIKLIETDNMFNGCENCQYVAKLSIV